MVHNKGTTFWKETTLDKKTVLAECNQLAPTLQSVRDNGPHVWIYKVHELVTRYEASTMIGNHRITATGHPTEPDIVDTPDPQEVVFRKAWLQRPLAEVRLDLYRRGFTHVEFEELEG